MLDRLNFGCAQPFPGLRVGIIAAVEKQHVIDPAFVLTACFDVNFGCTLAGANGAVIAFPDCQMAFFIDEVITAVTVWQRNP